MLCYVVIRISLVFFAVVVLQKWWKIGAIFIVNRKVSEQCDVGVCLVCMFQISIIFQTANEQNQGTMSTKTKQNQNGGNWVFPLNTTAASDPIPPFTISKSKSVKFRALHIYPKQQRMIGQLLFFIIHRKASWEMQITTDTFLAIALFQIWYCSYYDELSSNSQSALMKLQLWHFRLHLKMKPLKVSGPKWNYLPEPN